MHKHYFVFCDTSTLVLCHNCCLPIPSWLLVPSRLKWQHLPTFLTTTIFSLRFAELFSILFCMLPCTLSVFDFLYTKNTFYTIIYYQSRSFTIIESFSVFNLFSTVKCEICEWWTGGGFAGSSHPKRQPQHVLIMIRSSLHPIGGLIYILHSTWQKGRWEFPAHPGS